MFNSPRLIQSKIIPANDRSLSYKQAHEVEELLSEIITKCDEVITVDSKNIIFEDLSLTFLSPIKTDLDKYSEDKGAILSGQLRCDWNESMPKLEKYIDDDSQDSSLSNKSSIVILLEGDGKRILLTGDVTPDRFESILNALCIKGNKKAVKFDYIKLPHHGSYRNLNQQILSKINCRNFIITTNGKNSYLPNKKALLKIVQYLKNENKNTINFIFNYKETLDLLKIESSEKRRYNITLTPNNNDYGFSI